MEEVNEMLREALLKKQAGNVGPSAVDSSEFMGKPEVLS